tara:strand:+ start:705 stop:845 length:141 start_codon:yes stop_codon:yes gene_type:complete
MFYHNNVKEDTSEKRKQRVARAKKTREAYYAKKKSSKEVKNGTKKS